MHIKVGLLFAISATVMSPSSLGSRWSTAATHPIWQALRLGGAVVRIQALQDTLACVDPRTAGSASESFATSWGGVLANISLDCHAHQGRPSYCHLGNTKPFEQCLLR